MYEDLFNVVETAEIKGIKIHKCEIARQTFLQEKNSLTTTPATVGIDIVSKVKQHEQRQPVETMGGQLWPIN